MRNAYNEKKTVKIARDGQEVDPKTGSQLCSLFLEDESINLQYILNKSKNHLPSISTAELRQRRRVLGLPDEGPTSKEFIHSQRFGIPHKQSRIISHPYYVRPPVYPSYHYNLSRTPMMQPYYNDNISLPPYRIPMHTPEPYVRPLENYYKRNRLVNIREYHTSRRHDKEHPRYQRYQ